MGRLRERSLSAIKAGTTHGKEKTGQNSCWKKQQTRSSKTRLAAGKKASRNLEELELFREVRDLRFGGSLMRQAFASGKLGDWADFLDNEKLSVRARVNVRECSSEVEQEDENRTTIAQQIVEKSADFLRRTIVPDEGKERSHCRSCAHTATDSRVKTTSGVFRARRRSNVIGGVRSAGGQCNCRNK